MSILNKLKLSPWFIVYTVVFVYIVVFGRHTFLNADTDILWHIKQGEWLWKNNSFIIDREIFTYQFEYREWYYLSWLSDIVAYMVYTISKLEGIVVWYATVISVTVAMIFNYNYKKYGYLAFSIFLFLPLMKTHWLPRAHLYSHFFIVVWFIILDRYIETRKIKTLFILPLLQVLWVNLQSSFIYGFVIGGIFILGELLEYIILKKKDKLESLKCLIGVGLLTILTSLVNPFGLKYYANFFSNKTVTGFLKSVTTEFLSVNTHKIIAVNFVVLLIFMIIYFFKKTSAKHIKYSYILMLIFWQYTALEYTRHVAILGIVLALILPVFLNEISVFERVKKLNEKFRLISRGYCLIFNKKKTTVLSILFIVLLTLFPLTNTGKTCLEFKAEIDERRYPIRAVEYMKKNKLKGRIYNTYLYGGYLIWEYYPKKVVFIDPRASIYPLGILQDYFYVYTGEEKWLEVLKLYKIKYILVERESNIGKLIRYAEKWEALYEDEISVLYEVQYEDEEKLE